MKKITFMRSPHNYDMDQASLESGLECKDESLAQQHFKEECDINTLVERFHLTGEMPQLQHLPTSQDYEGIFDFQTAMNVVVAAREQFMQLPAELRARFHNEPQEFLQFCGDPENIDEIDKLGLLNDEARAKRQAALQAKVDAQVEQEIKRRSETETEKPHPSRGKTAP